MVQLYMITSFPIRGKEIVYYNVTFLHPILLLSKLIVYGLWADCDPCWSTTWVSPATFMKSSMYCSKIGTELQCYSVYIWSSLLNIKLPSVLTSTNFAAEAFRIGGLHTCVVPIMRTSVFWSKRLSFSYIQVSRTQQGQLRQLHLNLQSKDGVNLKLA